MGGWDRGLGWDVMWWGYLPLNTGPHPGLSPFSVPLGAGWEPFPSGRLELLQSDSTAGQQSKVMRSSLPVSGHTDWKGQPPPSGCLMRWSAPFTQHVDTSVSVPILIKNDRARSLEGAYLPIISPKWPSSWPLFSKNKGCLWPRHGPITFFCFAPWSPRVKCFLLKKAVYW